MDGLTLNLAGLKDKVANKLLSENKKNKEKKDKKTKKFEKKDSPKKELQIDELLRREALELGASEDDLKLLEGVEEGDSEQEFGHDGEVDNNFNDDLSKFMKNIGLDDTKAVVIDDKEFEKEVEEDEAQVEAAAEEYDEDELQNEVDESGVEALGGSDDHEREDEEPKPAEPVKEIPTHKKVDPTTVVNSAKLTVPPQIDWYNIPIELSQEPADLTKEQVDKLFQRGKDALEADNKTYYEEFSKSSSQRKFLSQILADGTLSDKISALTLLIQEAPLHNIKSFEALLNFTNKKSRNSALQSINALQDLLINGLLPDRKLRYFKNQPLNLMLSKKQLAIFYFEDFLKNFYFSVIQVLEKLSHDPIIHVRMNVVSHIFDLLKAKPEQEVNLLRLGVNKIGDIDNKVSAKTSYQILQLQQAHPNMKKIVIDAVIDTAFKKNTDYHTNYYSILTLNQTILTRREEEIANELVKTYFALFEKLLIESDPHNADKEDATKKSTKENNYKNRKKNFKKGKKGGKSVKVEKTQEEVVEEKSSKLFAALLTGLNRAFPFSNLPNDVFSKHLETLFKITHSSNFNTSVQSLVLIFQIIQTQKIGNDRFYRTLYESLFDQRLVTSSKQGIYLNLLFKALKSDSNIQRVLAFVKRIVQICYGWLSIGPITGMFYLLMELEKSVPQIRNLALNTPVDYKYIDDYSEEENFKDVKSDDEESKEVKKKIPLYDGRKRDPRFANAGNSSIWEINEFLNHYHPTVQLYAQSFLNKETQSKPDLGLFTLSHFLDRFVYRNAKQKPITKGQSIMQPLGGAHTGSLLVRASNKNQKELPANTENWLEKKVEDIRPDEQFFYQYFVSKDKDPSRVNEVRDEDFDQESELDDDEVWDALVKSQPEIDGDLGSDAEDFSDLPEDAFSDFDTEEDDDGQKDLGDAVAEVVEDDDDPSDFELQTIGMSDDDENLDGADEGEQEEDHGDEEENAEKDVNGFSESEDEEAELFRDNSEDELSSDEEPEPEPAPKSKKRSLQEGNDKKASKKSKKSKLRDLPVFASADDYAKYLDSDEE